MTITPPSIQVVHASDAPQHTGELTTILQRLKAEHRIADFEALDVSTNPDSISFKNKDNQGIIVLLTNEIERARTKIESVLKNITREKQDIKLIEIIIDNLPYHNNFISFPHDLMPIRSRDDMNLIWNGIEHDLQAIFPKPLAPEVEVKPAPTADSKKYLKLIGVSLLTFAASFSFLKSVAPYVPDESLTVIGVFSFLLPIIIFLLQKKKLEIYVSTTQEQNKINWKKLFIKTGTALVFFLEMFFVLIIMSYLMGMGDSYIYIAMFSIVVMLLILFYKGKTESRNVPVSIQVQSPKKKYLKLFGVLVLASILSFVLWTLVVERVNQLYNYSFEKDPYIASLTILTTICLLIITGKKKQVLSVP